MLIRIQEGHGPIYRQIHGSISEAILQGRLPQGARLPATRVLAGELGVSRTVVSLAYDWLRAEGYVVGRVGAGTFVSRRFPARSRARVATPTPSSPLTSLSGWGEAAGAAPWRRVASCRFDFRFGHLESQAFPGRAWRRAVARAARSQKHGYGDPAGSERLRRALRDYLARSRGIRCEPEQIMIVTGSQQAIDLVSRVLVSRADRIVMEDPFYPGAAHAFSAVGAELIHSRVDAHGINPARLSSLGRVRLAYVTPSHQFPSGAILPADRRVALLGWADRADALVVEDDYDSEFRYDHPPIEAVKALDRGERVIYMGTVSKVMSPAARLGYMVIPQHLVNAFAAAKWLVDRHSPTLEQEALADLIEDGSFERHIRRVRTLHARKRNLLLEELSGRLPGRLRIMGQKAGIHLIAWLTGAAPSLTAAVVETARKRDVGVYPVAPYYRVPPPEAGLLIGYSLPLDDIREGVRRLAAAIRQVQRG